MVGFIDILTFLGIFYLMNLSFQILSFSCFELGEVFRSVYFFIKYNPPSIT